MQTVYIGGVGTTKFGRNPKSLAELFCEAALSALSSYTVLQLDAIYIGAMNPEEFTGDGNIASQIADALNMTGLPAIRVETASSAGAAALHTAFHALASGYYQRVLVLGGEKMTHLSAKASTRILANVIDRQERQCGATMPALAALITEMYRERYRLSHSRLEKILCGVAIKNHLNGSHNPYAQFQNPITEQTYFSSKLVSTPLRLYDCSPVSDGAAAVILTTQRTDLMISGIGQGTGPQNLRGRDSFTSFPATQIAAKRAYVMAGISPAEIDFAEVHDAFTSFEIISTEDLGFFFAGKGWQAVEEGRTMIDKSLPINPSGGLKSRGHPVGATGVAQVVEIVRRLRGEVEPRFKREPRRALAQSIGGLGANNFVTIVERSDHIITQHKIPGCLPPALAVRRQLSVGAADLALPSADGKIKSFTILHVTPERYHPPLALALIRDRRGQHIMAQGKDISHLKIGRKVYLHKAGDVHIFTVKSRLRKIREASNRQIGRLSSGYALLAHMIITYAVGYCL